MRDGVTLHSTTDRDTEQTSEREDMKSVVTLEGFAIAVWFMLAGRHVYAQNMYTDPCAR